MRGQRGRAPKGPDQDQSKDEGQQQSGEQAQGIAAEAPPDALIGAEVNGGVILNPVVEVFWERRGTDGQIDTDFWPEPFVLFESRFAHGSF
jgi:hypothetical protein